MLSLEDEGDVRRDEEDVVGRDEEDVRKQGPVSNHMHVAWCGSLLIEHPTSPE